MDENDTRVMWWVADPSQVTIGKTYKFKAVMQTERDPDLLKSPVFKPGIAVNYYHREKHGVVTGNSVTITEPGISATFSADNAVDWAASSCSSEKRFDFWFNQIGINFVHAPGSEGKNGHGGGAGRSAGLASWLSLVQYARLLSERRMRVKPMASMPISPIPQENPASRTGAYWRQASPYFLTK